MKSWAANVDGWGDRTFVASYKGSDKSQRSTTGPAYKDCAVTIFGDPNADTLHMAIGLEGGKIAVCGKPSGGVHGAPVGTLFSAVSDDGITWRPVDNRQQHTPGHALPPNAVELPAPGGVLGAPAPCTGCGPDGS